jgi:hypothetical protein
MILKSCNSHEVHSHMQRHREAHHEAKSACLHKRRKLSRSTSVTCGCDERRLGVPGQVQQLGAEVGGGRLRVRRVGGRLLGVLAPRQPEAVRLQQSAQND